MTLGEQSAMDANCRGECERAPVVSIHSSWQIVDQIDDQRIALLL